MRALRSQDVTLKREQADKPDLPAGGATDKRTKRRTQRPSPLSQGNRSRNLSWIPIQGIFLELPPSLPSLPSVQTSPADKATNAVQAYAYAHGVPAAVCYPCRASETTL